MVNVNGMIVIAANGYLPPYMDTRSVFRGSAHGLQFKIIEIVHRWTFTPNKSETLVLLPKLLLKLCKHAKNGTCSVTTATPFRGASTEASTHS